MLIQVVTTKQKIKQWIKTCVPGMTPEKVERYSWPQAVLAMGLLQAYEQTKDKTALSSVFSYLRRWEKQRISHLSCGSCDEWKRCPVDRRDFDEGKKGKMQNLWKRSGSAGKGQTFAQVGSKQRKKLRTASLRTGASIRTGCLQIPLGCFVPLPVVTVFRNRIKSC